mmetsp:Transcript_63035/g.136904  ORF Transcript_63035/g.136904 Transcript_63035/m.136904 type:complete len:246 (+) Transcript_63035:1978-2715(+)
MTMVRRIPEARASSAGTCLTSAAWASRRRCAVESRAMNGNFLRTDRMKLCSNLGAKSSPSRSFSLSALMETSVHLVCATAVARCLRPKSKGRHPKQSPAWSCDIVVPPSESPEPFLCRPLTKFNSPSFTKYTAVGVESSSQMRSPGSTFSVNAEPPTRSFSFGDSPSNRLILSRNFRWSASCFWVCSLRISRNLSPPQAQTDEASLATTDAVRGQLCTKAIAPKAAPPESSLTTLPPTSTAKFPS